MSDLGSILLADDEETFLTSTSRLLCREGYDCRCARDGNEAVATLRDHRFDLLVTDIRMPKNPSLRVVKEARCIARGMPVILLTAYPTLETAIHSIELPVAAYLTKPVDFEELLPCVRTAIEHSRYRRTMSAVRERLKSCLADLEITASKAQSRAGNPADSISCGTIRTLASCLSELLELNARSGACRGSQNLCKLLDCPQQPFCREAILETIEVLKETKEAFKSKALAKLRTKLEVFAGNPEAFLSRN